jgi:hypothetical protein
LPAPPSAVELLALLTRVRSVRVATGELDQSRLYDLRAFKSCRAELAYLHRLAAGGRHGGTVVTSMRQLVAGLAPLHPAWKLSSDPWEDRDRHHQAVRRRLSQLAGAGLLRWRTGVNENLEERRTELELLAVPELLADELAVAAARLELWAERYDPDLNTGSRTAITNVNQAAAPLSASERQRRGCQRARHQAQAKRHSESSQTKSAPPFGAPTENNDQEPNANPIELRSVCGDRTRARAPGIHPAGAPSTNLPAMPASPETAASREGESVAGGGSVGVLGGIEARVQARRVVVELKELQVGARAVEVAGWGLERDWPVARLKEAWVVARHGAGEAALHGGRAAGPLHREPPGAGERRGGVRDDYLALRRAVARYERNQAAAREGFPPGGLAALLHLAVLAREHPDQEGPMLLAYGIGALDLLSRRMRAQATRDSTCRQQGQVRRAQARHPAAPDRPSYRPSPWPLWVVLDDEGLPCLRMTDRFEEVLVTQGTGPPSPAYERQVLRDAILLRYGHLRAHRDGRALMALRDQGELAPAERREPIDPRVVELARLTGLKPRLLARFTSEQIEPMLKRARAQHQREQEHAREREQRERSDRYHPDDRAP